MSDRNHWDRVYTDRSSERLSWFQRQAGRSLALIQETGIAPGAPLIDVGGGASCLAGELLHRGFGDLWVLDISAAALDVARKALGDDAARIHWLEGDITRARLPAAHFALWHDRAVFHFLTDAQAREAYVRQVHDALVPGGHVVIATFAEDGPARCSGLPVMRYDAPTLHAEFAPVFELLHTEKEVHVTPAGDTQVFRYCVLRSTES